MTPMFASETPRPVQALFTVVLVLVLGSLVWFLIRTARRRRIAAAQKEKDAIEAAVPAELRGHAPGLVVLILVGYGIGIAAMFVGTWTAGYLGGLIGLAIGNGPFLAAGLIKERAYQSRILSEALRRAESMDRQQLAGLVDGLERLHGRKPMRPLRHVLERRLG